MGRAQDTSTLWTGVLRPWGLHLCSAGEHPPQRAAMALRNVPFRSEVLGWDPDNLADYFRKVSLALWYWWGAGSALGGRGARQRLEGDIQAERKRHER